MQGNRALSPTLAEVIAACANLPEPGLHQVFPDHPRPRSAATLLPLVDADGHAAVVLTKRAGSLDHGGDWVFPGGRLNDDESHIDAARREAAEELGINSDDIEVIGQISTWGPIVTGYVIETYIGVVRDGVEFQPDHREVADIAIVPLAEFMKSERYLRVPFFPDEERHVALFEELGRSPQYGELRHYIVREDERLWGMQADMLFELLKHVTNGEHRF